MLISAIGYYQLLSLKLQQEFPDDSITRNDFQRSSLSPIVKTETKKEIAAENVEKLRDWSISERHRILIYQGDLGKLFLLYGCLSGPGEKQNFYWDFSLWHEIFVEWGPVF